MTAVSVRRSSSTASCCCRRRRRRLRRRRRRRFLADFRSSSAIEVLTHASVVAVVVGRPRSLGTWEHYAQPRSAPIGSGGLGRDEFSCRTASVRARQVEKQWESRPGRAADDSICFGKSLEGIIRPGRPAPTMLQSPQAVLPLFSRAHPAHNRSISRTAGRTAGATSQRCRVTTAAPGDFSFRRSLFDPFRIPSVLIRSVGDVGWSCGQFNKRPTSINHTHTINTSPLHRRRRHRRRRSRRSSKPSSCGGRGPVYRRIQWAGTRASARHVVRSDSVWAAKRTISFGPVSRLLPIFAPKARRRRCAGLTGRSVDRLVRRSLCCVRLTISTVEAGCIRFSERTIASTADKRRRLLVSPDGRHVTPP
jgi:hypothetical protein